MGMRPLNLGVWLQLDERRDEELELKTELLKSNYEVVVATESAGDEASHELLSEVKAFLVAYHPFVDDRDRLQRASHRPSKPSGAGGPLRAGS